MKKRSDFHIHSTFCDGRDTPAEMAETAYGLGFHSLGFSGHGMMPTAQETCMTAEATAAYRAEVLRLREVYRGRMNILCGLELDYHSDDSTEGFDYVIGSVHNVVVDGKCYTTDHTVEGFRWLIEEGFGSFEALAEQYYGFVADVVRRTDCDIIGHLDLITKFRNRLPLPESKRYLDAAFEAIRTLAPYGRPFEINVGAMTRGYRTSPYPSDALLREIRARGGTIIFSGDCHDRRRLADGFDVAVAAAKRCGFTEYVDWDGKDFSLFPLL